MRRVAAFDLGQGKDKYCAGYGPVPNRLPVISMSTRFHDKTVETADNPVYDVLFFCFFFCFFFFYCCFCKQVFCVFSREFQHNSIKPVQCVPLDFFF